MGVKERQERDREAVSRAILDAARDLFVAEGYQNVSIRKIAERIEYSPAAIYGYFPSKDDIFFALAEEGFRLLIGQTARTSDAAPGPSRPARLHPAGAHARYEFSKSHPEYFALMFLDRSVPRISKSWARFGFLREMRLQVDALDPESDRCRGVPRRLPAGRAVPHHAGRGPRRRGMRLCDRLAPGEDADALAVTRSKP